MKITTLSATKLVNFLNRNYGAEYAINETQAKLVIKECNKKYEDEFSEENLMDEVENVKFNLAV